MLRQDLFDGSAGGISPLKTCHGEPAQRGPGKTVKVWEAALDRLQQRPRVLPTDFRKSETLLPNEFHEVSGTFAPWGRLLILGPIQGVFHENTSFCKSLKEVKTARNNLWHGGKLDRGLSRRTALSFAPNSVFGIFLPKPPSLTKASRQWGRYSDSRIKTRTNKTALVQLIQSDVSHLIDRTERISQDWF